MMNASFVYWKEKLLDLYSLLLNWAQLKHSRIP